MLASYPEMSEYVITKNLYTFYDPANLMTVALNLAYLLIKYTGNALVLKKAQLNIMLPKSWLSVGYFKFWEYSNTFHYQDMFSGS